MKPIVSHLLKLAVGLAILGYLVYLVPLSQLVGVIRSADPFWFVISLVVNLLSVLVWSLRLHILLSLKEAIAARRIVASYFFGVFVGSVLPSSVGGDVGQAYRLWTDAKDKAFVATAIVVNRVTGVLALVFYVIVAGVWRYAELLGAYWWLWVLVFSGMVLGYVFVTHHKKAERFVPGFLPVQVRSFITMVYDALRVFAQHKLALLWVVLLGVVYQGMGIVLVGFLGIAVHAQIEWSVWMLAVPLVSLITLIPVSLAGLGIQDASYVALLSTFAWIASSQALAISLLSHVSRLLLATVGGVVYAWDAIRRTRPQSI